MILHSPYLDLPTDPRSVAEMHAENAAFLRELAAERDDPELLTYADLEQLRAEAGFR